MFFTNFIMSRKDVILSETDKTISPLHDLSRNLVFDGVSFTLKPRDISQKTNFNAHFTYDFQQGGHVFRLNNVKVCYDRYLERCIDTVDYWRASLDDDGYRLYLNRQSDILEEGVREICLGVLKYSGNSAYANSSLVMNECRFGDESQVFHILDTNFPLNGNFVLNQKIFDDKQKEIENYLRFR